MDLNQAYSNIFQQQLKPLHDEVAKLRRDLRKLMEMKLDNEKTS